MTALATGWARLPGNVRGAAWMVLAALAFSAMGACIKLLGQNMHAFQIAFFRDLFGLLAVLPMMASKGLGCLVTHRWKMHALRVIAGNGAMLCMFYAITMMPLATATAIAYARPLFLVVLAIPFLGETVGWRRGGATLLGFAGVLIIAQPGASGLDPVALIAVFAAFLMAMVMVVIKKMSATESPVTMLAWFSIGSMIVILPFGYAVWRDPTWEELGIAALLGIMGTIGQYAVIRAFQAGEATAVVPFDYTQIAFAWAWGAFLLHETVAIWTFIGAAIIIAANLYILNREARAKQPPRPPADPSPPS